MEYKHKVILALCQSNPPPSLSLYLSIYLSIYLWNIIQQLGQHCFKNAAYSFAFLDRVLQRFMAAECFVLLKDSSTAPSQN